MNEKRYILFALAFLFASAVAEAGETGSSTLDDYWIKLQAPPHEWTGIACSEDGQNIMASSWYGPVYISHDFGMRWTPTGPMANANSLAMSADGRKLFVSADRLYQSNNGGATWMPNMFDGIDGELPFSGPSSVKTSADGTIVMALFPWPWGALLVSTNSGATWLFSSVWLAHSIAMSGDGKTMVATQPDYGYILISHDFGATWETTSAPFSVWDDVAISANGGKIIATIDISALPYPRTRLANQFYISSDGGDTWNTAAVPVGTWEPIACSPDGKTIAVTPWVFDMALPIYVSHDGGISWQSQKSPMGGWTGITCSQNGGIAFASSLYNGIYLSLSLQ